MPAPNNKNIVELQEQDFAILQAIYEEKITLTEYAVRVGIAREAAEIRLGDALRRRKTAVTFLPCRYSRPEGTQHMDGYQGFRTVPRSEHRSNAEKLPTFVEIEDLDDWLEID